MAEKGSAKALPALEVVDEIGSTNVELLARGRAGAPHGTAIRARVQTAGRGQRAHGWTSPEGGLYFSVLIRPQVPAAQLPGLPVACALGVLRALHEMGCVEAKLKWPNDVVVDGRKLVGILTELTSSPEGSFAVCGIGLNIHAPQVPARGSAGAVALAPAGLMDILDADAPTIDLDTLASHIRFAVLDTVASWQEGLAEGRVTAEAPSDAPLSTLVDAYNARLAFLYEPMDVYAIDGDIVDSGVFAGVDVWGRATVLHEDAEPAVYDATAVSLRPAR